MAFRTNKTPVLQEKTASGSVASFNTILQKPLVNGEFSIQAYQEGSGYPSPVNIRNIIPFNTQKITKAGKNLFDPEKAVADSTGVTYSDGWLNFRTDGNSRIYYRDVNIGQCAFTAIVKSAVSSMNGVILTAFYTDGTSSPVINVTTTDTDEHIVTGVSTQGKTISYLRTGFTNSIATFIKIQMSIGSTATDYEPYNAEVKAKALGEDVYGGSYNSVSGNKRKTHELITFDGSSDENWIYYNNRAFYIENAFANASANFLTQYYNNRVCLCNLYRETVAIAGSTQLPQWEDSSFFNQQGYIKRLWVKDTSITSLDDFKAMLSNTPLQISYPIAEPIETNIGATPISTNIGNNTIFCDTGDSSVSYKDLDIAKRGNFREVFRLPS